MIVFGLLDPVDERVAWVGHTQGDPDEAVRAIAEHARLVRGRQGALVRWLRVLRRVRLPLRHVVLEVSEEPRWAQQRVQSWVARLRLEGQAELNEVPRRAKPKAFNGHKSLKRMRLGRSRKASDRV